MTEITVGQFNLVYNALSFTIAAMGAATLFLWLNRSLVAPPYRMAVTISGLVTAIALYHYIRIFASWDGADIVAKALFGLLIFAIALRKSEREPVVQAA